MDMPQEEERILKQSTRIRSNEKEKPSIFSLVSGTLILTNRRLLYLKSRLGTTIYGKREDYERDLKKKGSFEIPIPTIIDMESDYHKLIPYFNVKYQTDSGPQFRCFWSEHAANMTEWVEGIYQEMEKIREVSKPEEGERPERDLVIVDQSHDQVQSQIQKIVEMVNGVPSRLNLEEPIALQGKPKDELLVANEHLFPRTVLLMSIGTKSGKNFSQREIDIVVDYVRNGGKLFISSWPPWDPPNHILEHFGIQLSGETIVDEVNHDGKHNDHIIVRDFADHPINDGVETICFGDYGCQFLETENPEISVLAFSSVEASPPKAAVAALVHFGEGQVCVIGQTTLFQDQYVDKYHNARWFENMLEHLLSEKQTVKPVREPKPTPAEAPEKPEIRYCTNCGAKLEPGDIFCGECGQKIIS
jgi:hypothetical protein